MKANRTLFISLLLLFSLTTGCAVQPVVDPGSGIQDDQAVKNIRTVLRHGHWLVTRGVEITDNFVATVTNAPLSHAAIYDAEREEVIEATGEGVHTTPIDKFLGKSQRVMVLKPLWWSAETAPLAIERVRNWVGKKYNYSGLIGINTPDRYYCTQLAVRAYEPFIQGDAHNPIPPVIKPSQMYFWGTVLYDTGP